MEKVKALQNLAYQLGLEEGCPIFEFLANFFCLLDKLFLFHVCQLSVIIDFRFFSALSFYSLRTLCNCYLCVVVVVLNRDLSEI